MPRYSLRTLMIVMLLAGPVLAGAWAYYKHQQQAAREKELFSFYMGLMK